MPSTDTQRLPSAIAPVLMSAAALLVVALHVAFVGMQREADEGAAAHLWQLLIALQLPVIAYYAARYVPAAPRRAGRVLLYQGAALLAALAPVYLLHL